MPWATFHSFRHALATLLHAERAKTNRQLSDWLGHGDPSFTLRTYVTAPDLGSADFLDGLIPDGVAPNVAPTGSTSGDETEQTSDLQEVSDGP
jgi:hypothetical protein